MAISEAKLTAPWFKVRSKLRTLRGVRSFTIIYVIKSTPAKVLKSNGEKKVISLFDRLKY
jgi:hypothetical protein